jgi:hypothetical protein
VLGVALRFIVALPYQLAHGCSASRKINTDGFPLAGTLPIAAANNITTLSEAAFPLFLYIYFRNYLHEKL